MGRRKKSVIHQQIDDSIDMYNDTEDYSQDNIFQDQQDILKEFEYNDDDFAAEMTKKRRSKQFYVKGKDLIEQIRKYQQSMKNDPQGKGYISEQLGLMILKICTRFSLHPKFFGYSYRDQMVADAVTRCLSKGVSKIDLSLTNCNPFSYFTQIALNCFRARINSEKRFMSTKQRYREEVYDQYERQENLQRTKDNNEDY